VLSDRGIAWRNVQVTEDSDQLHHLGVLGGNFGTIEKIIGFELQTLGRHGKPEPIEAKVHIRAYGAALDRFREAERETKGSRGCEHLGGRRFHLSDWRNGLRHIRSRPGESLPFTVEFSPEEHRRDYAVRVIQYEEVEGKRLIIGGQTFVFGKVEGFPIRTRASSEVFLK
jgi:hypothetical protein